MLKGIIRLGVVIAIMAFVMGCAKSPAGTAADQPDGGAAVEKSSDNGTSHALTLAYEVLAEGANTIKDTASPDILPRSAKESARHISTMDMELLKDRGKLLAIVSLQGLINREEPRIFLRQKSTAWLLDYYKSRHYVESERSYVDPYRLIADFMAGVVKGAIVIDPQRRYTINMATNIAGVEDRIIITPEMIPAIRALGIVDIKDLRSFAFVDDAAAYRWVYATYYPRQRHDLLGVAYYERYNDLRRDYLIAHKVPTFWLPAASDPDYSTGLEEHVNRVLREAPANIPIFGWWQATDSGHGKKRGVGEEAGVRLAGRYGKFVIGDDFVANYSYHSGIAVDRAVLRQQHPTSPAAPIYDPQKKYVAITLLDSGYASWYWQSAFPERWWTQKERGEVAISYGIAPALYDLAPGLVEYLYRTASAQDNFFAALSGMGYSYPFEDYAAEASQDKAANTVENRQQILADYFDKSARLLKAMDLSALALYSHPWQAWEQKDYDLLNKVIVPHLHGIRTLVAGMGRDEGFSAENGSHMLTSEVSLHHTLTRWPSSTLITADSHADLRKDKAAVKWLVEEIRATAQEGQFIEAMALSWVYGPRRLKMVSDILTREGFVFLTLDRFDEMFRAKLRAEP